MAILASSIAAWLALKGNFGWAAPFVPLAMAAGMLAVVKPSVLRPFNRAWMRLGLLLGKVMSPVVFGIIFFGLITPIAAVTRLFGRDELRLKRDGSDTYWRLRGQSHFPPHSFRRQY